MKTIGIDLDGVIVNFSKGFIELAREVYGKKLPKLKSSNDIKTWKFEEWYPIIEEQVDELFNIYIHNSEDFWINLSILDLDGWKLLRSKFSNSNEYRVYFITHRSKGQNLFNQTVQWLRNHAWNSPQVIFSKEKYKVINGLDIEYFIDDNLEICSEVSEKTNAKTFIMDYPYNRIEGNNNLIRVKSLEEFINYIDS